MLSYKPPDMYAIGMTPLKLAKTWYKLKLFLSNENEKVKSFNLIE